LDNSPLKKKKMSAWVVVKHFRAVASFPTFRCTFFEWKNALASTKWVLKINTMRQGSSQKSTNNIHYTWCVCSQTCTFRDFRPGAEKWARKPHSWMCKAIKIIDSSFLACNLRDGYPERPAGIIISYSQSHKSDFVSSIRSHILLTGERVSDPFFKCRCERVFYFSFGCVGKQNTRLEKNDRHKRVLTYFDASSFINRQIVDWPQEKCCSFMPCHF